MGFEITAVVLAALVCKMGVTSFVVDFTPNITSLTQILPPNISALAQKFKSPNIGSLASVEYSDGNGARFELLCASDKGCGNFLPKLGASITTVAPDYQDYNYDSWSTISPTPESSGCRKKLDYVHMDLKPFKCSPPLKLSKDSCTGYCYTNDYPQTDELDSCTVCVVSGTYTQTTAHSCTYGFFNFPVNMRNTRITDCSCVDCATRIKPVSPKSSEPEEGPTTTESTPESTPGSTTYYY